MGIHATLLEAVTRLNELEDEYKKQRGEVANLLREAMKTNQVTNLSRLTEINRTTIYWLINTWSTNNENGSSQRKSTKG